MRRIGALTIVVALLVTACGTVVDPAGPASSTTTQPEPTATTVASDATTTSAPGTTTSAPTTTTTTASTATTTTTSAPGTTSASSEELSVAAYFFIDEEGRPNRHGPFLVPVSREVAATRAVGRAAIEQLLAGPDAGERAGTPSISSAIPDGVRLLRLDISGGVATVDLSSEFGATGASAAAAQRFAQVVFTLTRFPTVERVAFRQDGAAVEAQTGDGRLVSGPVSRDDYLEFAAAISVEQPMYDGEARDPLRVTGFAAVFEATLRYALTDRDGLIIEEGFAMTDNGTGWGQFDFTIDYDVDETQVGALIVWADSAEDGSRIDIREYPVALTP